MAHQYPQAGRCLQQVTHQVFETNLQVNQSTYSYVKVGSSNKSFAIKETGSLLIVESYCQGWLNGSGGGLDMTIYWNGGTGDNMLGRGSSSNGNGWSRVGNGGDAYRSYNIGRIHSVEHGLNAGQTIEIGLGLGAWSTSNGGLNWGGYKSLMGWWCMEFSREGI